MHNSSYSDVFHLVAEPAPEEAIQVGDEVRMGQNLHPHFRVVAVSGDKAWVRDEQTGEDHIASLSRCRKLS